MQWYYAKNNERYGPYEDDAFLQLVEAGTVEAGTLVWNPDLPDWKRYQEVVGGVEPAPAESLYPCAECGGMFPEKDLAVFGGMQVCAEHKPIYFQRVKQGTVPPAQTNYAGFWTRAAAKILDYVITGSFQSGIQFAVLSLGGEDNPAVFFVASMVAALVGFATVILYNTWFLGRFGATPGKMAFGIRVILPGEPGISYLRALGRTLGEIVSGMVFYIGYIMAAFDAEHRALHDFFCDTRVVKV